MSELRIKTYPEILTNMLALADAIQRLWQGPELNLNPGSVWRTLFEASAMSDAEQHIQIGKTRKFFSLFRCKGNDLDERMIDYGSELFPELRRLGADVSRTQVIVGDGTTLLTRYLTADVAIGATTIVVDDTTGLASAGALVLEYGTPRQETVYYTSISGTTITLSTQTPTINQHPQSGSVMRTALITTLLSATLAGATSATVATGTGIAFPTTGSLVFAQGTVFEEKRTFTRVGDVFTVPALTYAHAQHEPVVLSTFGSDRTIAAGSVCSVPATEISKQIDFRVVATNAKLLDGYYVSNLTSVESLQQGSATMIGAGAINKWQAAPFSNATVINPTPSTGGRDRELDEPYLRRAINHIRSLTKGTPISLVTLVSAMRDPETNQRVAFAQIIEPVAPGMSTLYISDGTPTFALEQQPFIGRDVIIGQAEQGDRRGVLHNYGPFVVESSNPITPRLFVDFARGLATSTAANSLTDSTASMPTNFYVGAYLKTNDNQFYRITANTGTVFTLQAGGVQPSLGAYSIFDFGTNPQLTGTSTSVALNNLTDSGAAMTVNAHVGKWVNDSAGKAHQVVSNTATAFTFADNLIPAAGAYTVTSGNPTPLTPNTDFTFNPAQGDIELSLAMARPTYGALVAASDGASGSVGAYTYTRGLGAYVQRQVNGDAADPINFPGIRYSGSQVLVAAPNTMSPAFVIQIESKPGFSDSDLYPFVTNAVVTYVNSLGMGENIQIWRIATACKNIPGLDNLKVLEPTSDITVPQFTLPRITADNVEVV